MSTVSSLAVRIAAQRSAMGLTQGELGRRIGVSKQAVWMWEHGERQPDAAKLRALAVLFGCTADYLLGLSDDPHRRR